MEELFAIEELACSTSPVSNNQQSHQTITNQTENDHKLINHLIEIHSKEDPVLLQDTRVLNNLIVRQQQQQQKMADKSELDYFKTVQTEVKPHMRKIVSDWMLEVTEEQQCQPEVFHLAINYLDRYLATRDIKKSQFQLIASVCMFLASKFKETCPLPAEHLVIYTDYSVKVQDIMQWEMPVLDVLKWDLSAVTPYTILDHILRKVSFGPILDPEVVRKHAETFVALAATEHLFSLKSPVTVAVACLGAAIRGLNPQSLEVMLSSVFTTCGEIHTDEIRQCMNEIEVSINLSMSGMSFQPTNNNNVPQVPSKMSKPPQQQKTDGYPPASTTPTDIMEICVS